MNQNNVFTDLYSLITVHIISRPLKLGLKNLKNGYYLFIVRNHCLVIQLSHRLKQLNSNKNSNS